MFINAYNVELTDATGSPVTASLRLSIAAQIKLKKRFDESTITTLFTAIDDPEKFVAIMEEALNWTGNTNTLTDGAELIDLMAANGLLGMSQKQHIITRLAQASGILSESERAALDAKSESYMNEITGDTPKNA